MRTNSQIFISLPDVSEEAVKILMDCVYTGKMFGLTKETMDDFVILDEILGLSIELRIRENFEDKADNEIDKEGSFVISDNGMKEVHEDRGLNFKKLDRKVTKKSKSRPRCLVCLSWVKDLDKHVVHNCKQCENVFETGEAFAEHCDTVHDGRKAKWKKGVKCLVCLSWVKNLNIHDHKCKQCEFVFRTDDAFMEHCQTVHDGRKAKCEECEAEVLDLRKHAQAHVKSQECPDCHRDVKWMNIHRNQYHKEGTLYQCEICPYTVHGFRAKLEKHRKKHIEKKSIPCNVCGRLFRTDFHVRNHMMTHTQNKMHKCDKCNSAFSHANNLRHHAKTHTN